MQLTAILLLAAVLQVSARGAAQTVTYTATNEDLLTIFQAIKQQTGYSLLYRTQDLQNARRVTVSFNNTDLTAALQQLLANQNLEFEIQSKSIFIRPKQTTDLSPRFLSPRLDAPPITIRGQVVDGLGSPVAGTVILLKGTSRGTTTNTSGHFELEEVDENAVLVVSGVNIETSEIKVRGKRELLITVTARVQNMSEVIINKGYYTEKQRLSTGNVSVVRSQDIEKQPVSNPLQALQGRVPGLDITQATGVSGGSINVQIRGRSSLDANVANDPLYIVDGVPYTSTLVYSLGVTIFGQSKNGTIGNPFNYLNPSDIASVEVLKDADATAIYGSRGANGVILITTKKGRSGKTKFDFDIYAGAGKVNSKLKMLNTKQYVEMRKEAFANDNAIPQPWDDDLNDADTVPDHDWKKTLIGGTARFTNVQATISGGNTDIQYLVSGTYRKETTVFPGDYANSKGAVNFNVTGRSANKKFLTRISANYLSDNNNIPIQDLTTFINLPPNSPVLYNPDGTLNDWSNSILSNPLSYLLTKSKFRTKNLISNATLSYELLPSLNIETAIGYTNMQVDQVSTTPLVFYKPALRQFNTRTANFVNNNIESWIIEPKATYEHKLGKGTLNLMVGATIQQSFGRGQVLNAEGFNSDVVLENIQAAPIIKPGVATDDVYKYNAGFARINYNLMDKYIVNLTGRRDGSSRFGPERQFHNFGAIGVAWVFSDEKLFRDNPSLLDYGKIRASYGSAGNDQVGNYRFLDLYRNTVSPYQDATGLTVDNLFNPELAWELNKKFEVALELGFWQNRVNLSACWYNNRSSNQLVQYTLPGITGFTSIDANLPATVQNSGVELVLNTVNVVTKRFRWSTSINITIPKNRLVNYPGIENSPYANTYVVGKPITIVKVFEMLGVDPTTGQYQFADGKGNPVLVPDFATDANKVINIAPVLFGGFQNNITFKGFQLDFLFQFVKQTGINYLYDFVPGSYVQNQPVTVLDRWRKPGDIAPIQRFNQDYSLQTSYYRARSSDHAYSDASFIRLKNIYLSYQLPENIVGNIGFENIRIYLQGQNLVTITDFPGLDPETQSVKNVPPLSIVTTGIRLGL